MKNYPPPPSSGRPGDPSVIPPGYYRASDGHIHSQQGYHPQGMDPRPPKKGKGGLVVLVLGVILVACVVGGIVIATAATNTKDQAGPSVSITTGSPTIVTSATTVLSTTVLPTTVLPTTTTQARTFDRTNYEELVSAPDRFKGSSVNIVGRVFGEITRDSAGVFFQMFADPKKSQGNTVVGHPDTTLPVKTGDYALVKGRAVGAATGQNAMGGIVQSVQVIADSVSIVDALAAATPASRTTGRSGPQSQNGLSLTIEKVEFAVDETRVHLVVKNDSPSEASFYSFNAKAVMGDKQYDESRGLLDYPDISSTILPGVRSAGLLVFPPMGPGTGTFVLEARTKNYRLTFAPFRFSFSS